VDVFLPCLDLASSHHGFLVDGQAVNRPGSRRRGDRDEEERREKEEDDVITHNDRLGLSPSPSPTECVAKYGSMDAVRFRLRRLKEEGAIRREP